MLEAWEHAFEYETLSCRGEQCVAVLCIVPAFVKSGVQRDLQHDNRDVTIAAVLDPK